MAKMYVRHSIYAHEDVGTICEHLFSAENYYLGKINLDTISEVLKLAAEIYGLTVPIQATSLLLSHCKKIATIDNRRKLYHRFELLEKK